MGTNALLVVGWVGVLHWMIDDFHFLVLLDVCDLRHFWREETRDGH
jgi:hypothetical protein